MSKAKRTRKARMKKAQERRRMRFFQGGRYEEFSQELNIIFYDMVSSFPKRLTSPP